MDSSIISVTDMEAYFKTISNAELQEFESATVEDVLLEIQRLGMERSQSSADKTLRIMTPLISFVDRHAKSMDSIVQNLPCPAAIVWGCLRAIIRFGVSIPYYFDSLLPMIEKLGSQLLLYNRYDQLFHERADFQAALAATHRDALIFLRKVRKTLSENAKHVAWLRRTWVSFESEFADISQRLAYRLATLDHLCSFIHREALHQDLERQEAFRNNTTKALQQLVGAATKQSPTSLDSNVEDLISWLNPTDYHGDWLIARQKRFPDTCQWLFEQKMYQEWAQGYDGQITWMVGKAGTGKTILSASVIDQLQSSIASQSNTESILAYFFFRKNDADRNTTLSMYRSVLAQIVRMFPLHSDSIRSAFSSSKTYGRRQLTWSDEPQKLLQTLLERIARRTFLILDGLDECEDMENHLSKLVDFTSMRSFCRCLISSRDIPYIRKQLGAFPYLTTAKEMVDVDIGTYLRGKLDSQLLVGQDHAQLISLLTKRADGQFLFAALMAEELNQSTSPADLQILAQGIPERLSAYYDQTAKKMMQTPSKRSQLAQEALSFVFCSIRPITWRELQYMLALSSASDSRNEYERLPYKDAVLSICQPFIEYDANKDIFQPAHYSMYQSLTTEARDLTDQEASFKISLPHGHHKIAKTLLKFLKTVDYETAVREHKSSLLLFATTYWCHHFLNSHLTGDLIIDVEDFLLSDSRRRAWLMDWLVMDRGGFPLPTILRTMAKLSNLLECDGRFQSAKWDVLQDTVVILTMLHQSTRIKSSTKPKAILGWYERDMIIRDLIRSYNISGRLEDGIKHFEEARTTLGNVDEQTVWILHGLGLIHDQLGDSELALTIQYEALNLQESNQALTEVEQTLTHNEIGRLYRHQGKYSLAKERHLYALSILRKYGLDSSAESIFTKSHLAKCYRKGGQLPEAIKMHKDVLNKRVALLGPEHPHALWDMSDLAKCHAEMGESVEACKLQEESVRLRQKVLGMKHNDTLWAMNDLALMYEQQGNYPMALKIHSQALEGQTALLGLEHPTTCWTHNKVLQIYSAAAMAGYEGHSAC